MSRTKPCRVCGTETPVNKLYIGGRCIVCENKVRKQNGEPLIAINGGTIELSEIPVPDDIQPDTAPIIELEKQALANEQQQRFDKVEEAKKERAARELARRHLLPFIKRNQPNYDAGWVHADICQRLERFSQQVREKKSPRLMLCVPPRHGKQLADSTPIYTPTGWTTHGELKPGDEVFHPSGRPIRVIAVSDKTPSDYVVEFTNGAVIRCHANHEWTLTRRNDRVKGTLHTLSTVQLASLAYYSGNRALFQLPDVETLIFPTAQLELDPYVLGVWLGDGSRGKGCITHALSDQAIVDKIESRGYPVTAVCPHKTTGVITTYFSGPRPGVAGRLYKELQILSILNDKHIPQKYLNADIQQRLELMAGLIDTDGHVELATGRVRFTTCDKPLADCVYTLAAGLGFRPYIVEVNPTLSSSGIQGRKMVYVVGFQPTMDIPCALERKRSKVRSVRRKIGIKSIRYEPNGEFGHCIQVDSPDGLYLAGHTLIPTHNSEIASRNFPAWHLGNCPEHEIIQASYASDLALDFSRKVRDLMKTDGYKSLFDARVDPKSAALERWNTTSGGAYTAVGVRGPITGRGAHIGIIDDPVKDRQDAESETLRQQVKDWYSSTFYTRLAPGGGIVVIMTRWHEDDLAGWLVSCMEEAEKEMAESGEWPADADRWEVIRYPAIAEEDEPYRKAGEPLHESRYPISALNKIKRTLLPRDWAALYQQRPSLEDGDFFVRSAFRFYAPYQLPKLNELAIYTAWDLAIGKGDHNDYTVCVIVGVARSGDIYVLRVMRGRWNSLEILEKIFEVQKEWNPILQGIEQGHIESSIEPVLIKEINRRKVHLPYEKLKHRGMDKVARAQAIRTMVNQGRIWLPAENTAPWVGIFLNELIKFPGGKHDDQVDAFAWIGQMVLMFATIKEKVEDATPKWMKKLLAGKKKSRSAMTA